LLFFYKPNVSYKAYLAGKRLSGTAKNKVTTINIFPKVIVEVRIEVITTALMGALSIF